MLPSKTKKRYLDVFLPFHAAEQHREVPLAGSSERLPFLSPLTLLVRFLCTLKTGHKHPKGHKGKQRK
jgi:hypothetical protein